MVCPETSRHAASRSASGTIGVSNGTVMALSGTITNAGVNNVPMSKGIYVTYDTDLPVSSVTFPASGNAYNSIPSITGSVSSPGAGFQSPISTVTIAIRDQAGNYFNGSAFVSTAGTPIWLGVTALYPSSWTYTNLTGTTFTTNVNYQIGVIATTATG